jgi:hypothetical protein
MDMNDFYSLFGSGQDQAPDQSTPTGPSTADKLAGLFGLGAPSDTLTPDQQSSLKQATMMGIASGLLQAGGNSPTQVSFGQALGQGLKQGQQSTSDMLNGYFKQNALAQQAKLSQSDAMAKQFVNLQMLQRMNFDRMGKGLPALTLSELMQQGQGKPSVQNVAYVPGISDLKTQQAQPQQASGYTPTATDDATLAMVHSGNYQGTPMQLAALASKYENMGDTKTAEYYRNLAYNGVGKDGGFISPTGQWGSVQPIMDKAPGYIGQTAAAKAMPEQQAKAAYAGQIAGAENQAKWLAPIDVHAGGQVFGKPPVAAGFGMPMAAVNPQIGTPTPTGLPGSVFNNSPIPTKAQEAMIDVDKEHLKGLQGEVDAARQATNDAKLIQSWLPSVSTGLGADKLKAGAEILKRLGVSDDAAGQFTNVDPTKSQEMTKKFFNMALTNMKATVAGREAGFMQQSFLNANPNMDMTPEAITGMTNGVVMSGLRKEREFAAKQKAFSDNLTGSIGGKPYQSIQSVDSSFNQDHAPEYYGKAAQLVSGDKSAYTGMTPDMFNKVKSLLPRGSTIVKPDGTKIIWNGQ